MMPAIQQVTQVVDLTPLKGAIKTPTKAKLTVDRWFSGDYQPIEEEYLNETFGFRSVFVRINNQIAFSFFRKAKANGVIIGKKNYLYEKNYLKAYGGLDYIGSDSIRRRIERLKLIQDTLATLNKQLVVVFAAGKGSFYPEYFPDEYAIPGDSTNYSSHVALARNNGLNFIDFNSYFVDNKLKSPYPLYPQYGIHWSHYGMSRVADSLIKYIEKARQIDMPDIYWDEITLSQPLDTDYDIADGMNILFRLKSFDMAYPRVKFESDSGKVKPSVLVISDSFYWGIFNMGFSKVFSNDHFWFYNKQIYPDSFKEPLSTDQINLIEEISKHDVIIIMATEATLPGLGWGFIEQAFNSYTNPDLESKNRMNYWLEVEEMKRIIRADSLWMNLVIKKAADKNIDVDSMLVLDAKYVIDRKKAGK